MLSTAIVDRASGPWIHAALGTRLGPQRRQGVRPRAPGTRAGGSAAARPPRPHKSASPTQSHLPKALAAAAARPLAAASTTAPTPWLRGSRAAFQRGTVALRLPPGRAPAPRSPLTSLARVPQACAAGCCCWLLAAGAAGAHHVRLGGTCGPAAPYSPSLIRPWRPAGAADILWARAAGRGCTAITSPTSPPALLPPQPSPHPRFGPAVTQPLSGSHPM